MEQQARIEQAAALLVGARQRKGLLKEIPEACRPMNGAEAHAIQDAVTGLLGETVGAFKAAAPVNEEPWRGVIYTRTIRASPAAVVAAEVPNCGVEAEVAFRFNRDFPGRSAAYTREEVAAGVDACAAIEVIDSRFQDQSKRSTLEKLADCVSNGGFVHAEPVAGWQRLDFATIHVVLTVNGQVLVEQDGGHPTSDPLGTAVVLVNMLRGGDGVRSGQFVTCGSYTGMRFLKPGDTCAARFEGLGLAEVTFTR
ncbi:MAG TPA: fumarylacetoacetate hydrolase family protein [Acetobacteraceae bacterium]|nr:fumarylacetoacetate hydrolase family protein [Acetobacteraceae bacterium]